MVDGGNQAGHCLLYSPTSAPFVFRKVRCLSGQQCYKSTTTVCDTVNTAKRILDTGDVEYFLDDTGGKHQTAASDAFSHSVAFLSAIIVV
ncbi:unnamed protein product [Enterobius vermicularis]|uniref:Sushi domain-containing protein n=1 Tax=Enterobius vermicularis TaxID=51028 RepID=A0A0N4VGN0_ENTVE|nr:unnamed protein product [Enterobius vermicularis]